MCGKAIPEIVCRLLTGLALLMQITALIIWPVLNSDTIGKNIFFFAFLVNLGYRKRKVQNKSILFLGLSIIERRKITVLLIILLISHFIIHIVFSNSNFAPKFLFFRNFFLFLVPVEDSNPVVLYPYGILTLS